MKEFTREMLEALRKASDSVKGTQEYYKYDMCLECKTNNRWHFVHWSRPYTTGRIKTVKDKTYIITQDACGESRYTVTEEVRELLGI